VVDGAGKAGLIVSVEECVFSRKAGSNTCMSPSEEDASTNLQFPKCIAEFNGLVFMRYLDHVAYNRSMALAMQPQVREAVGWLVYECEQYVTLVWDKDAMPPTLKGGDPKASGLVLLRSDIVEFKRLGDFLPLQNNSKWYLNSHIDANSSEYAFQANGAKNSKNGERRRQ
jgi:hypothetical protein